MLDRQPLLDAYNSDNMQAFIWALRFGEGTQAADGFQIMFGGERFQDFSDHPRRVITKTMKGKTYSSSAAGVGQFLVKTWDGLVKQYGFEDFSPKNQLLGIIALIKGRGALGDVLEGRISDAVRKCNREWASLPGSPYGQPVVTMEEFMREYQEGLDNLSGTHWEEPAEVLPEPSRPAPDPVVPVTPAPPQKGKTMNPFLLAVMPTLLDLVPKLGKIFGSGSEVAERNVKAAEIIVNTAKEAIGARNEQELVDMVRADPEAATAVRSAIEREWFKLEEVGGGIAAARASAEKYALPGGPDFKKNPAFWISLLFLVMPQAILVDMLFVHPDSYDVSLRTQIITAVLALLSIVGAFWLGTNFTTTQKNGEPGKQT